MRKRTSFDDAYDAIVSLGSGPVGTGTVETLRLALGGRVSLLAAAAADVAGRRGVSDLIPDMIAAFDRFLVDGAKSDKLCNAKIAIVNALNELEYSGDEVFLTGASYVQMEPSFGRPIDTATQVRIGCANGLARTNHPDALYILTDLLVDTESAVRSAAARALGYIGRPESELLLRLKILTGDSDPDTMRECFDALIGLAPERSVGFVARYLDSDDPSIFQWAAIAIGGSRLPRAFELLRDCWDNYPSASARRSLLLPIALVRSDEAFDFLVETLRTSERKTALEALYALRVYASEDSLRVIHAIAVDRGEEEIIEAFRAEFGSPD